MTYTVGLIGVTGIGRRHGEAFRATDGIELVALADLDEEGLAASGEDWNVPADRWYTGHGAMLDAEDLDAVSVATPAFLHHEHAIDAVRSPASPDAVFSEKPIATSVTQAREMVDVCDEAGVELVIDHSRRFNPAYRRLRGLIREDDLLGEVQSVQVQSNEELLASGTHIVDLVLYLLGLRCREVRGGYLTDHADMGGSQADVTREQLGGRGDDSGGGGIAIGEDGTFVMVDHTTRRHVSSHGWLFVGTGGMLSIMREPYEFDVRYWTNEDGDQTEDPTVAEALGEQWDWDGMYPNAAAHVVELLDGGAENRSPGADALHALEILVGMFVSHYTDGSVDLPLERPLEDVTITH